MSKGNHSLKKAVKKHLELEGCGKKVAMYVGIVTVIALMMCWASYYMGKKHQEKQEETSSRAAASRSRAQDQHLKSEIERLQKLLSTCRGSSPVMNNAMSRRYIQSPSKK
jgi:uncharacterized protein YlxW (UPF0749 family)